MRNLNYKTAIVYLPMVQWFLPGFSACINQFETCLTRGILLDADMSWREQDFSCATGSFDSDQDLTLVVFHHDLSSNVEFEIVRYIIFSIVRDTISIPT